MTGDRLAAQVAQLANLVEGPHAYFEIVALGEAALPALAELLRGPAATVYQPRCLAADAIAQIGGPAAADALLQALVDSDARVLDPVLRAAEDVVTSRIAEQLGGFDEPRVREALLSTLRRHPYLGAVTALARLREPRAAPLLAGWLADDTIRAPAADALCRLGRASLPEVTRVLVCPRLVEGMEPPTWIDARVTAASILQTIGGDAAELPLAWVLGDDQPAVRRAAALALAGRWPAAIDVVMPVLFEGLASDSWVDRDAAANALRTLGADALSALARALPSLPRDGALVAVTLLAEAGDVASLGMLHTHSDRHVRWAAVEGLAQLGAPAEPELARFARDAEPQIRRRARRHSD